MMCRGEKAEGWVQRSTVTGKSEGEHWQSRIKQS